MEIFKKGKMNIDKELEPKTFMNKRNHNESSSKSIQKDYKNLMQKLKTNKNSPSRSVCFHQSK